MTKLLVLIFIVIFVKLTLCSSELEESEVDTRRGGFSWRSHPDDNHGFNQAKVKDRLFKVMQEHERNKANQGR